MNTATDSRRSARPASYRTVSLARRAYNLLEEMILTLRLEPGCIVTEQELIRMTGLGRTPIREALLQLGREKLVEVLPRKGIMVCDINIAQHLTLLEARRVLDRLIAENAALRATPVQRAHLKRIAAAMEQEAAIRLRCAR